jgi:hypothetical protein
MIDCQPRTKRASPSIAPRAGKSQLDPRLGLHSEPAELVSEHGQSGNNQREWQRPPESPLEVLQLTVVLFSNRDQWLQSHSAFGAVSGMILPDLRMHRAGIDRSGRNHARVIKRFLI